MKISKRFQRVYSFWEISIEGNELTRTWGKVGFPGRSVVRKYSSHQDALAAANKCIREKRAQEYYQLPDFSEKKNSAPVQKARETFPLLDSDNIIAAEIDDNMVLRGIHLKYINSFLIRGALLNKNAFKKFQKLEWLRIGEAEIRLYVENNRYKRNLKKLFPNSIMSGDAFEFLFLLDYLSNPNVLGGIIRKDLLYAMNYMPNGLLQMIVQLPTFKDRKKVISCNGGKLSVYPLEYFPVISRGDGGGLGLMIDDGVHWRGLIEHYVGEFYDRGSLLLEFLRSLKEREEQSEFIEMYDDEGYIDEGRYSSKGYIEDECYSSEFCELVALLTKTLLSENKIDVTKNKRGKTYIFNYENPASVLASRKKLYKKGSTDRYGDLGILVNPKAYSLLPQNTTVEDIGLYFIEDIFGADEYHVLRKFRKSGTYREGVFSRLDKLEYLANNGYPEPALIWGRWAWHWQYRWFGDREYQAKVRRVLATAYKAMKRDFLAEVVNTIEYP